MIDHVFPWPPSWSQFSAIDGLKMSKKKVWDHVMKRANWTVVVRVGCGSQPTY